ncbi:hypothetical protein [Hyphomicrobium sulfonivorans]|nr:hypothetical protein [Hyphomicrobium sulfonivorans]
MASVDFPLMAGEGIEDLPRTIRREREARERAAREREAAERAAREQEIAAHDSAARDRREREAKSPERVARKTDHGRDHVRNRDRDTSLSHDFASVAPQAESADYDRADYTAPSIFRGHQSPSDATAVSRFDVPFAHLMAFSIKAVVAAIPALVLLTAILWVGGALLKAFFPELIHMQILITFPDGSAPPKPA